MISRMVEVVMLDDRYWVRLDAERDAYLFTKDQVLEILRLDVKENKEAAKAN